MGMAVGGGSKYTSDINVTPMVDVMLVLLIIFMVVTPMLQAGVTVVLPKADNPEEDQAINKETAIVVAIPENNVYYVGRDQVDSSRLAEKIKGLLENRKLEDRVVYIKGGHMVSYGSVVTTIEAIRESGVDRIGLVSEKRKEKDK
ncbi:MAG: biopolymer transporter ExbD [Acidobacteriota bacterium]|nr:biopolymer transporter ExbD [Blastocatellia bacterium]MDW8412878.1 biopolymer transporter ExbD [Acidobacteriota bacterium]